MGILTGSCWRRSSSKCSFSLKWRLMLGTWLLKREAAEMLHNYCWLNCISLQMDAWLTGQTKCGALFLMEALAIVLFYVPDRVEAKGALTAYIFNTACTVKLSDLDFWPCDEAQSWSFNALNDVGAWASDPLTQIMVLVRIQLINHQEMTLPCVVPATNTAPSTIKAFLVNGATVTVIFCHWSSFQGPTFVAPSCRLNSNLLMQLSNYC